MSDSLSPGELYPLDLDLYRTAPGTLPKKHTRGGSESVPLSMASRTQVSGSLRIFHPDNGIETPFLTRTGRPEA